MLAYHEGMERMHSARRSASLRSALISLATTLSGALLVIGIVSLFAVWSMNRAWREGLAAADGLEQIAYEATQAQVDFKIGVQEWKNILLRGESAEDLRYYQDAFEARQAQVAEHLATLEEIARKLGLAGPREEIEQIARQHGSDMTRYRKALQEGLAPDGRLPLPAATKVDRSVRGIDRRLERGIDALAAEAQALASERLSNLSRELEERYYTLRSVLYVMLAVAFMLVGLSLFGALRATRNT
jgi:methyl-accepting chemotaxis protein